MTCDGNSTKSRGTRVPLNYGYFASENMPCSAWPNSWNAVVTSSQVSSVGLPSGGLGMLRWLAITGCVSLRSDWLTWLFMHAPPRLDARAYVSTLTSSSCVLLVLHTSSQDRHGRRPVRESGGQ